MMQLNENFATVRNDILFNASQAAAIVTEATSEKSTSIYDSYGEFLSYLLISQINSVESINRIEYQINRHKETDQNLETSVETLNKRLLMLEETMNSFKDLTLASRPKNELTETTASIYIEKNLNDTRKSYSSSYDSKQDDPFSSLLQVCCNLYDMENTDEDEHCKNKPSECEKKPQIEVKKDDCEIISIKKGNSEDHLRIKCVHCSHGENCSPDSYDEKPLTKEEEDRKELQRLFNKRVKYEVNKKFGPNYLAKHQVRELDVKEMYKIKKKVLRIFSPFPLPVKAAWNNAMNSLRQDRHQLKKKKQFKS